MELVHAITLNLYDSSGCPLSYTSCLYSMCMKRTNIVIDEKLAEEGMALTGIKTYKELVDMALQDLVRRAKQKEILKLKGNLQWEGDLDAMRETRAS